MIFERYWFMREIVIGICDDLPQVVEELSGIICGNLESRCCEYQIKKFHDGEELLKVIHELDVVFLDIEMPKMDGIEVGKIIQERKVACKIIMATARVDRFKEAFRINAFRFITKPFDNAEIEMVLDDILKEMIGFDTVELYLNRIPYHIHQKDIMYIKAYESYVGVQVKNREMMRKDVSLVKMLALLDERLFYRADRKYVVNLRAIDMYDHGVIKLGDLEIKLPRVKKKEFEKIYEEFLFTYS